MDKRIHIPVYQSPVHEYVRISDLPESFERLELERWVKDRGLYQPLIQGEGKGVREYQDCVFLTDYISYLEYKDRGNAFLPLDS